MTNLANDVIIDNDSKNNRNEDFETKALDFFQAAKDMAHEARKIHIRNENQAKQIKKLENENYTLKQQLQSKIELSGNSG